MLIMGKLNLSGKLSQSLPPSPSTKSELAISTPAQYIIIIVYGDARFNPKQHRKNIEQMVKLSPDLILHTGDIVASGIVYEQW